MDGGVNRLDSLVRDENLPAADNLGQRDGLVALPRLQLLRALDKDNEVLVLALVVHLGLLVVSAGHDGGRVVLFE